MQNSWIKVTLLKQKINDRISYYQKCANIMGSPRKLIKLFEKFISVHWSRTVNFFNIPSHSLLSKYLESSWWGINEQLCILVFSAQRSVLCGVLGSIYTTCVLIKRWKSIRRPRIKSCVGFFLLFLDRCNIKLVTYIFFSAWGGEKAVFCINQSTYFRGGWNLLGI